MFLNIAKDGLNVLIHLGRAPAEGEVLYVIPQKMDKKKLHCCVQILSEVAIRGNNILNHIQNQILKEWILSCVAQKERVIGFAVLY